MKSCSAERVQPGGDGAVEDGRALLEDRSVKNESVERAGFIAKQRPLHEQIV
jgi:hypothetical protein